MKLVPLYEEIVNQEHRDMRIQAMRKKFNLSDNTVWIQAYHGTSVKNVSKIENSGFKEGTWFAVDRETSERYALQAGGKPYVMTVRLYIGSLLPTSDFITSQERLMSTSQGYVPKDLVKKVYELK